MTIPQKTILHDFEIKPDSRGFLCVLSDLDFIDDRIAPYKVIEGKDSQGCDNDDQSEVDFLKQLVLEVYLLQLI